MDFKKISEGIFSDGFEYQYSKPDREYVFDISETNLTNIMISERFLDIIGVSDELKNKFKDFETQYGRMPKFSYGSSLDNKIEFQKTINGKKVADFFTEEDRNEIVRQWIKTYKDVSDEENIYKESADAVIDKTTKFIKENKLGIGCAIFGVCALAGIIPAICNTYKNGKDIREAVEYYMGQVEWDKNDESKSIHRSIYSIDAKGNPTTHVHHSILAGNKATAKEIFNVVAKAAKKNGTTVRQEFHNLDGKKVKGLGGKDTDEDAFRFNILKDKNGVLTIEVWNQAGRKPKTFEIDTNSYQKIGNVQYSWNESKEQKINKSKIEESFKRVMEGGYTTFTNHIGEKDSFYDPMKSEPEPSDETDCLIIFGDNFWEKKLKDAFLKRVEQKKATLGESYTKRDEFKALLGIYNRYMDSDIIHDLRHDGDYVGSQQLQQALRKMYKEIVKLDKETKDLA